MDLFTLPIFVVLLKTPSNSAIIFPISVVLSSFLMFQLPRWNHFHSVFLINDFSSFENVFISSSFLKDIFGGHRILGRLIFSFKFISVQFSHSFMSESLWPMDWSMPGFPVNHQLLELAQTHVHWVSDAIQSSHPLSSPSPPAFNLSQHQGLFSESVLCIRWPKHCNFSFTINPSNDYSELISFRMDWLYLFAVQETLKCLLQHHSSKASVLWCTAFFIV